jgi:hypothetical protein
MAFRKLIAILAVVGAGCSLASAVTFVPGNVTLVVPGNANIFGAGQDTPPDPAGGGGGILPPSFTLDGSVSVVTFPNISGNVILEGGESNNAYGDGGPFTSTNITSTGGISGITALQGGFLVGVFTSDDEPQPPGPAILDFTTGSGANFTTLSPALNQTFFIGGGRTLDGTGTLQQFNVPAGATHLYLGIADGDALNGPPGFYSDNSGFFTVTAAIGTPIVPVSINPCGNLSNNNAFASSISGNGKVIGFTSLASDLVHEFDPNGAAQVFVWNCSNNTVSAVSTDPDGNPGDFASSNPRLSKNGMYLTFTSYADNLVPNDYNGSGDVFYLNLCTGNLQLVSQSLQWNMSANGNSGSDAPAISGDGQYVAFSSNATDLLSGCFTASTGNTTDTSGPQLYLWSANDQSLDLLSFAFDDEGTPVTYPTDIPPAQRFTGQPAANQDATYVAFISNAANFEDNTLDGPLQAYVYIGNGGDDVINFLSFNADGDPADADCANPSIDDDGDTITFESAADNLVDDPGPANTTQIYVTDPNGNSIALVSCAADSTPANASCFHSHLSADGHLLIFTSNATNLVPGKGGNSTAIFIKNILTGSIVSGGNGSSSASFSDNAQYVAYTKQVLNGPLSGSNSPLAQVFEADLGQSAPTFIEQPQSDEVTVGDDVTLSVSAKGTPSPTYQWYFNGQALEDETCSDLKLGAVTTDDAGDYYCVATNSIDSVQSDTATLTVDGPSPPYFSNITGSVYTIAGQSVTLEGDAQGDQPITYQWNIFNGTTSNWDPILGATNNTLIFDSVQTTDSGNYEVVATNDGGSTPSDDIILGVVNITDPPGIASEPEPLEVTVGDDASFSVSAYGFIPFSYQWYTTDGETTTPIPDATSDTLDIPSAQFTDATSYFVSVTNDNGVTNSTVVPLTVDPGVAPVINPGDGPYNSTVYSGDSAYFYFYLDGGTPPLDYQWYFNGTPLIDQTSDSLFLSEVSSEDAGNYTVEISNTFGNFTSDPAILTVLPALTTPEITQQPVGGNIAAGLTANLTVVADSNPSPNYQWLKDNVPLTDGGNISGSTTPNLVIANITPSETGNYSVIVFNGIGDPVQSDIVPVCVLYKPIIVQQPIAQLVRIGLQAIFVVVAEGNPGNLTYQWSKNGQPLVPSRIKRMPRDIGLNGNRLVISNVQTTDAGIYQVKVTNTQGSTSSATVGLQVRTITAPKQ